MVQVERKRRKVRGRRKKRMRTPETKRGRDEERSGYKN